ncbi:hypothetical protein MYOV003v1_p0071 [Vibrio phage 207E48.1]|nr:hypothetical protein MYOV003v1_p0071 [Vibrio phage 207E48.1]
MINNNGEPTGALLQSFVNMGYNVKIDIGKNAPYEAYNHIVGDDYFIVCVSTVTGEITFVQQTEKWWAENAGKKLGYLPDLRSKKLADASSHVSKEIAKCLKMREHIKSLATYAKDNGKEVVLVQGKLYMSTQEHAKETLFQGDPDIKGFIAGAVDVTNGLPEEEVTETPTEEKAPPIGLVPENIYDERCNDNRINDILDAMDRYRRAGVSIPPEWAQELKERLE